MNSDHTQVVIEKILEKYFHDGNPDDYCLLQILPDGGKSQCFHSHLMKLMIIGVSIHTLSYLTLLTF